MPPEEIKFFATLYPFKNISASGTIKFFAEKTRTKQKTINRK
jgi:hypothetical protein